MAYQSAGIADIFPSAKNGLVGLSFRALCLRATESCPFIDRWFSNFNDTLGNILLHLAAHISDYELTKLLQEKGADLTSINMLKRTALHIACEGKSLEIIKLLAEKSPPCIFDLRDIHGHIPLEVACRLHCPEAVQILLSQGNIVFGKGDRSVLANALRNVEKYVMPITSLLLEAGANIDTPDEVGRTPLYAAVIRSERELQGATNSTAGQNYLYTTISMTLINRGCDVNIPWWRGQTALHAAVQINHETLVRKLLICGSDIDRADGFSCTPLYYACVTGNQRVTDLLIICGANLQAQVWETYFENWRRCGILNEKNNQLLNYVIHKSRQCLSLVNLCNITIRKNIRNIEEDSVQLGLSPLLVKRLQLRD